MASHTLSGQLWPEGTSVSVYPANAWVNTAAAPSGQPVATGTVSGGNVSFTGLAENVRYVAYGGSKGVTFLVRATLEAALSGARSPDRQRIAELEDYVGDVTSRVAVMQEAPLNVTYPEFGGDLSAAVAALPVSAGRRSGEIIVPHGAQINVSSTIVLDDAGGVVLRGLGRTPGYPRLVWTGGAGSGPMIRANSAFGVELRNLVLGYSNAAFNGDLISTDQSAAATDVAQLVLEGCYFGGLSGAVGAASLVKLNKTIASVIRNCKFENAAVGIRRGSSYVTTLTIKDCEFAGLTSVAIRDPDNRWTIEDNIFEPLASGAPGAIDQSTSGGFLAAWVTGLKLAGNYMADATIAGTWVKLRSSGGVISGNYMVIPANGTGFYLEQCYGLTFIGVDLQGGLYGIDFANAGGNLHDGVTILGGQITASTPIRNPLNCANLEVRGVYPVTSIQPRGVNEGYVGVASAATLTLPGNDQGGLWLISGTTTITSIPASWPGRVITLVFSSTAQVTDGGNLKLASNFTGGADRTLTLRCDGTNWFEVARSVN